MASFGLSFGFVFGLAWLWHGIAWLGFWFGSKCGLACFYLGLSLIMAWIRFWLGVAFGFAWLGFLLAFGFGLAWFVFWLDLDGFCLGLELFFAWLGLAWLSLCLA